ncbi:hypothetical protein PIB30_001795 [Stylosanthes scabra]|uniref:Uncharacterized protein n=1 Tax=Stylosanthes scabra TaxID=79078 RepID=A0ABU6W0S0_9FABA|nr:hypothetical protein [Stylosanthes scabra]
MVGEEGNASQFNSDLPFAVSPASKSVLAPRFNNSGCYLLGSSVNTASYRIECGLTYQDKLYFELIQFIRNCTAQTHHNLSLKNSQYSHSLCAPFPRRYVVVSTLPFATADPGQSEPEEEEQEPSTPTPTTVNCSPLSANAEFEFLRLVITKLFFLAILETVTSELPVPRSSISGAGDDLPRHLVRRRSRRSRDSRSL